MLSPVHFFVTLWTTVHQTPLSMEFSSKNTGVVCHFLLQGIFQIRGMNPHPLSHWGSPTSIKIIFFFKKEAAVLASAAHILKIGTIQRRLAWPLCKDDTQIREAFHIFPGVGDGQGGLACCDSWGCKELDMTEQLTHTLHILKGIKWNKSLYLESHRHSLSSCEVFNVWVAAHGKHSHDPVSWDQLEPMSYICSSWGQLFTQTKNSIPKFRLYLCSIINYKKSMATVSFQGHKCYSEELESLRKIIKTHPPCECALLSCWKGLKNWVLPPERTWTQC